MAPQDFYAPVVHGNHGRNSLVPKAKVLVGRKRPALAVAAAMEYEEILGDLDRAMREVDSDKVKELVPILNRLSEELKNQPGLAAHLERGRFGSAARERLRKEYIGRYVLLRGGAPTYPNPEGQGPSTGPESAPLLGGKEDEYMNELTEQSVRHGFIQKVYGILSIQLLITTLIGGITMILLDDLDKRAVTVGFFVSMAFMIGTMCLCVCRPDLMRSYPTNYIILGIFTLAESILIGFVGAQYTQESVLIVAGVTALVVSGLSLFACQTSYDFSGWGPYLFVALLVGCGFSFAFLGAAMFGLAGTAAFQGLRLVFACCMAMLFSFYIVYDTQLIIGGKHQNMFAIDDYCLAALSLYMDIINLFLYLLEIFGDRR